MSVSAFTRNDCGTCRQTTLHKFNACLHCGTRRSFCEAAITPEFNRSIRIETFGQSEAAARRRLKRAAQRERAKALGRAVGSMRRFAGRKSTLTPEQEQRIIARHQDGESFASIGRDYGMTGQGIGQLVKRQARA